MTLSGAQTQGCTAWGSWPGSQESRASSAPAEAQGAARPGRSLGGGWALLQHETHDGSLGRALGPSPTLSFSAQMDLSPGQGSASPPWGDSQYPMAVKGPRRPTGPSLHLTTGAARTLPRIAPLMRTERKLERGEDRSAGMRRALPQPRNLDRLRRAGALGSAFCPSALPGLDAKGLSRGHWVTPRPGPYSGPQVRRSTRCSSPSQSRAQQGLASRERTRPSALPSQTASKTTSSNVSPGTRCAKCITAPGDPVTDRPTQLLQAAP